MAGVRSDANERRSCYVVSQDAVHQPKPSESASLGISLLFAPRPSKAMNIFEMVNRHLLSTP